MTSILIRGGIVIHADRTSQEDILIEEEKIAQVGVGLKCKDAKLIDATGLWVIPGGIDVHTHMELVQRGMVSSDDFYSGTLAALHGGTTTIIDFANQDRGEDPFVAITAALRKAEKSVCDYGFHLTITDVERCPIQVLKEVKERYGITSFKTFLAYPAMRLQESAMRVLLGRVGQIGGMVTCHAEAGDMVEGIAGDFKRRGELSPIYHSLSHPAAVEAQAIGQLLNWSAELDVPIYIVHVSSRLGINALIQAKAAGRKVYAESCPQYLLLDAALYEEPDFALASRYVMTPPLRSALDRDALWQAAKAGDIDVIATDHCPFTSTQKACGIADFTLIPNGAPGVEHRVSLLYSQGVCEGRITVNQWVNLIATNPAKLFGLYPRKGVIRAGSDADLVLFDPQAKTMISAASHHMRVDYSVYEGFHVQGYCRMVIARGEVVIVEGKALVEAGRGCYLKRA